MTTEYVVEKGYGRSRSLCAHSRDGPEQETIYTCYVTDENRMLLGLVTVRTMLLSEASRRIEDIMETNIIFARTLDDGRTSRNG